MKTRFLIALVGLLAVHVFAAEDNHTGFRVFQERADDSVTLVMKSDYCIEFTVTLEATLKNMTPSRPVPFTVDAAGRRSFVLARVKVTDKTRPWSYDYHYYWEYGGGRELPPHKDRYTMPL